MRAVLLVALGGALGALARWAGMELIPSTSLAILCINTIGSFAIGLAFTQLDERYRDIYADTVVATRFQPLLVIGWLGAFTTYSSLALHIVHGMQDGYLGGALSLLLGSLVLGVVGLGLGILLGRRWHAKRQRMAAAR